MQTSEHLDADSEPNPVDNVQRTPASVASRLILKYRVIDLWDRVEHSVIDDDIDQWRRSPLLRPRRAILFSPG